MNDLGECGANMTTREKLALLYGLPGALGEKEKDTIGHALECTLTRELKEEFALQHKVHYTFSNPFQLEPKVFVHGANGQHCLTKCTITFFEVLLTPAGDALLASGLKGDEIFVIDELLSSNTGKRRLFLDLSDKNVVGYLVNSTDSASHFELRQGELTPQGAKSKKADEPVVCIVPMSLKEPLKLGDLEIDLKEQRYVDLLLLLGLNARFGDKVRLESDSIERKRWGWLKLDRAFCDAAHELDRYIESNCRVSLILLRGDLCRLRVAAENIFFCNGMFYAEMKGNEFVITRRPQYSHGVFVLDEEPRAARLSQPNMQHLINLRQGNESLVSRDNLRKLSTTGNQPLDDFAQALGIYRMYEAIDPDRSKDTQVFRFAIQVR